MRVEDLGLIDYKVAWDYQTAVHKKLVEEKLVRRHDATQEQTCASHRLIFCEHPHVYTLGKSGSMDHLLLSEQELADRGVGFYKINRGGDITYHGQGQLVVYPILDLEFFFRDVHRYVRSLEEAVIRTIDCFGIEGIRLAQHTGVWVASQDDQAHRKICAIGVHLSRWVSLHGLALNVEPDLGMFDNIVPCGISDQNKTVTSIGREANRKVPMDRVKTFFCEAFAQVFECEVENTQRPS